VAEAAATQQLIDANIDRASHKKIYYFSGYGKLWEADGHCIGKRREREQPFI